MEDLGWEDLGMRRGRGLAGGWRGAGRGLAGQALCLDERPQTHMPKPYIALRRQGKNFV